MQCNNESESKSFKLQKNSSPKKTCETNEDEEAHKYVMPSLPRHNSHGGHQHYPHHDPSLYSSYHLHHHMFHPPSYHGDNGYNFYPCSHSPYNSTQRPHHGGPIDSAPLVPHTPPQYHQGNNNKRSFHHIMDSASPCNHYPSPRFLPGSSNSRYSPRNYSPIRIRQRPQHYYNIAAMDITMAPSTQRNHPTRVVGSRPTRQYHEKRNHIMERRRDSDGSTINNIHDECEPQFQPQPQQPQAVTQSQLKKEEERIYHHQQQHQQERSNKRPRLSDYLLNNDFDGAVEEGKSKDNKNDSSSRSQWGENPFMSVYQYE